MAAPDGPVPNLVRDPCSVPAASPRVPDVSIQRCGLARTFGQLGWSSSQAIYVARNPSGPPPREDP
jgi:hypothetical protein